MQLQVEATARGLPLSIFIKSHEPAIIKFKSYKLQYVSDVHFVKFWPQSLVLSFTMIIKKQRLNQCVISWQKKLTIQQNQPFG